MGLIGTLQPLGKSSEITEDWSRSGSREYLAAFDPADDENTVRNNLGFAIFLPHPSDNGQVIIKIGVEQNPDISTYANGLNPSDSATGTACNWWKVSIGYGPWNPLEHTATGNPVDQPISPSFQWQYIEEAVDYDLGTGMPILNSAGDPFDPPVTRDELRGEIKISENVLTYQPSNYWQNGNFVNNDYWNGFPPYTVKWTPPNQPERLYSQFLGQNYYRLESSFLFNPNLDMNLQPVGWNAYVIDRGFTKLVGGYKVKIMDLNAQPVSTPVLLDGSGGVLATGATPYFFTWQRYPSISFNATFPKYTSLFM